MTYNYVVIYLDKDIGRTYIGPFIANDWKDALKIVKEAGIEGDVYGRIYNQEGDEEGEAEDD